MERNFASDVRVTGKGPLLVSRFAHVRSFAPHVLGALSFEASVAPSEVLDAVKLLQAMNADGRRHVPAHEEQRCEKWR